jgi:hypothetical protein
VIVAGTAAAAKVFEWDPRWPAFGAAVIGALQLVFDFNGRGRIHENLQRRYFELIAQIDGIRSPTEDDMARWKAALSLIYADEPPPMRALDAIAYNKACDSLDRHDGRLYVNPLHWLLSQFYSFPNTHFSPSQ